MSKAQFVTVRDLRKNSDYSKHALLAPFYDFRSVYLKEKEPETILLQYSRDGTRFLGLWPDPKALENRFYKLYSGFVILLLTVFWSTIAGDICIAGSDIVAVGESLMFLMGVSIIYFKALLLIKNWPTINENIEIFIELWSKSSAIRNSEVQQLRRFYYLAELCVHIFFYILASFLFAILSIQPLLSGQATPIPALFPFNWHNADIHPWSARFVYVFQVFVIFVALLEILYIDSLGVASITQTSLNLRILSIQLRELGLNFDKGLNMLNELRSLVEFHQKIIDVNEKCNKAFYGTYIVQMGACTFILGLAGFETLYAKDQPMVAFKFLFFMCVATMDIFYWCMIGNIVYFDSVDVSVAAFEAHEWFNQSPVLQRNLMFVILRAQKPLVFRARPFLPFTFETFTRIIKTSYTSFTLLCNTSE